MNCVRSDFEHNVFIQLLSFPIRRMDYLAARIMGTWFIVLAHYIICMMMAFFIFAYTSHEFNLGINIPLAIMVNGFSLLSTIIIAVFLSFFFNKLLSFLGVLFVGSIINLCNSIYLYRDTDFVKVSSEGLYYKFALVVHFLFPRLGTLNHISGSLLHKEPFKVELWQEGLHYVVAMSLLIGLVLWTFSKKEPLPDSP